MKSLALIAITLLSISCAHRPRVTSEVTAYGELPAGPKDAKLGVLWATSDQISAEDKMVLNHIAKQIVDEARLRGINAFIVKTDEDFKALEAEKGMLAYPNYSINEKSTYIPPSTYTYSTPSTNYHSGTVNSYSTGNSYNYSGTTTTQKQNTVTTGGYTRTEHCRHVTINYLSHSELAKEKPEVSYLQKIKSCGSNSDIRVVIGEMLESAFIHFGKEGQFKETIYTDEPRNSSRRYAH